MKSVLLISLFLIFIMLFGIFLSTLIFWGIGNLAVFVFSISYDWTIWHGLLCALLFTLLKEMFSK